MIEENVILLVEDNPNDVTLSLRALKQHNVNTAGDIRPECTSPSPLRSGRRSAPRFHLPSSPGSACKHRA